MRVVFLDADDVRIRFGAACKRLGEGDARRAFSMALNKGGRKAYTAMRRALSQQSSIPRGAVNAAMRFKGATPTTLSTTTSGSGRHLPLSSFGAKQFSYGVRARIWGRAQTFRSAFIVNRYGNGAFKRKGNPRFPIEQLWGPAVPVEMLRDEAHAGHRKLPIIAGPLHSGDTCRSFVRLILRRFLIRSYVCFAWLFWLRR